MKNAILLVLWLSGFSLMAQPVLEHSYSESAAACQLENLGEIYYAMDVVNKECHLYDTDHNLLKSIPIPTPPDYFLLDIQHISETLFNQDNLVEFVYIYSKYVPTTNSHYYIYESKLINENGTILLSLPGTGHTDVIETTGGEKKFLAYQYDQSIIPYRTTTHVYALPGGSTKSAGRIANARIGNAYPNPASHQIRIPVTLPEGISMGRLVISDLNGKVVKDFHVDRSTGEVTFPAGRITSGTYLYYIRTDHFQTPAGKVVIR